MDPITAALVLAGKLADVWLELIRSARPEQKQALVQGWIDDQVWWRSFIDGLTPKRDV